MTEMGASGSLAAPAAGSQNQLDPGGASELSTYRRVRPPLHFGWWVAFAAAAFLLFAVGRLLVTNQNLEWNVVWSYLGDTDILMGLLRTLELTAISMTAGILGGMLLAVMQMSPVFLMSWSSKGYVWLFRGTPLLVQIVFWYNIAALLPSVSLGIPFGPTLFSESTNVLVPPFVAALLALSLNEAAYMAEVVRGGLLAVEGGQTEAAKALGMTRVQTLRVVVIPQALRVIVPPTGNQVISMLKATALVSVTATPELLYSVQTIYNRNYKTIPLLIVASIWYLVVTSILYVGQYYIERRYARGDRNTLSMTPFQKLSATIGRGRLADSQR